MRRLPIDSACVRAIITLMSKSSVAELIRKVAHDHADIASPKQLAPFVLEELRGQEAEVLQRLLPAYISSLLRRRTPGDGKEWESFLEERVATDHGTVFGKDATTDDLRQGADRRRLFAGRLDKRAAQYDGIADIMTMEGADRAGDVSAQGQSLLQLSLELATLRSDRRRNERHRVSITTLQAAKDSLASYLSGDRNPIIEELRGQREELLHIRKNLNESLAKSRRTYDRAMAMAEVSHE